ncbi:MAG: bacterioferritin [Acidobacteria bacterium]|nr:bacterioferritin [Acidobacteriota bacterium]
MGTSKIVNGLNAALEREMGNVIRYLHHSFLVRGVNRGPLVDFFRNQAKESFQHATVLGEKIVALGGHPSIEVPKMKEIGHEDVTEMLHEELEIEKREVQEYTKLLKQVGDDIALRFVLEEIIKEEQEGIEDLEKRLR